MTGLRAGSRAAGPMRKEDDRTVGKEQGPMRKEDDRTAGREQGGGTDEKGG